MTQRPNEHDRAVAPEFCGAHDWARERPPLVDGPDDEALSDLIALVMLECGEFALEELPEARDVSGAAAILPVSDFPGGWQMRCDESIAEDVPRN